MCILLAVNEFSEQFERCGARHAAVVAAQLEAYNDFHPSAEWQVDLSEGRFTMGGKTIDVHGLGSFGTDGSWLWAWANEPTFPPGSKVLTSCLRVREIGQRLGIPEFVTPRLELGDFSDPRMAAERIAWAAMGVIGSRGYAGVSAGTGARVYLLAADQAVPLAEFSALSFPRMVISGINVFSTSHSDTVVGYFDRFGISHRWLDERHLVAVWPGGTETNVDFDERGRFTGNSGTLSPASPL